jgi:hypothetical protein
MNKLLLAVIASTFTVAAAAQTGTVSPATVGDHGTPAMQAEETAKNVAISKTVKGLSDTKARQQAVTDATKVADHGTPAIHTADAAKNVATSKGQPKAIANNNAAQDAVQQASKGATK